MLLSVYLNELHKQKSLTVNYLVQALSLRTVMLTSAAEVDIKCRFWATLINLFSGSTLEQRELRELDFAHTL